MIINDNSQKRFEVFTILENQNQKCYTTVVVTVMIYR